jgi:hypothetical protein
LQNPNLTDSAKKAAVAAMHRILAHDTSVLLNMERSAGHIKELVNNDDPKLFQILEPMIAHEIDSTVENIWKLVKHTMESNLETISTQAIHFVGLIMRRLLDCESNSSSDCFLLLLRASVSINGLNKYLATKELYMIPDSKIGLLLPNFTKWIVSQVHFDNQILINLAQLMRVSYSDLIDIIGPMTFPELIRNRNEKMLARLIGKGKIAEPSKIASKLLQFCGHISAHLACFTGESSIYYFVEYMQSLLADNSFDIRKLLRTAQLQLVFSVLVIIGNSSGNSKQEVTLSDSGNQISGKTHFSLRWRFIEFGTVFTSIRSRNSHKNSN